MRLLFAASLTLSLPASWVVLGCGLLACQVGCEKPVPPAVRTAQVTEVPRERVSIDAGVVFADRENYLCLPMNQVGLSEEDQIVALASSCECVQPRLVRYVARGRQERWAVMLEFVADEAISLGDQPSPPADLGVIIEASLADGTAHAFTVNLLHTSLVSGSRDDAE